MSNIRNINEEDFFSIKANEEKIKFLLRYAILAPSTHNSQPWKFRIKGNECEVHKDLQKFLPEADIKGKNMHISLGCCIENLIIASKYFNIYRTVIYHIPRSSRDTLVATIEFKNLLGKYALNNDYLNSFLAIQERTTHRGTYKTRKIDKKILNKVIEDNSNNLVEIKIITNKNEIKKIAQYTQNSIKSLYSKKSFRKELSQWINHNFSSKKEGIPGYSLKLPSLVSLIFPLLLRYINISQLISLINYKSIISMSAICIICGKDEASSIWLEVGRVAERIMLQFTSQNINVYITVASVDTENTYKKIRNLINSKYSPQFLFGLGYSSSKKIFTPRIQVKNKII